MCWGLCGGDNPTLAWLIYGHFFGDVFQGLCENLFFTRLDCLLKKRNNLAVWLCGDIFLLFACDQITFSEDSLGLCRKIFFLLAWRKKPFQGFSFTFGKDSLGLCRVGAFFIYKKSFFLLAWWLFFKKKKSLGALNKKGVLDCLLKGSLLLRQSFIVPMRWKFFKSQTLT